VPDEYLKRHRMRRDLDGPVAVPPLPAGFRWRPWHDSLVDAHADVLLEAFAGEPDALIFPSLRTATGCRMLMRAVRDIDTFCPAATWLLDGPTGPVGAIQGLTCGGIQNVAVLPDARGRGFGTALVLKALAGYFAVGVREVELEVTAANAAAVALYRRLGFRAYKSLYRSVDLPDRGMVGLGL
jgi:hypothetical protein